MERIKNQTHSKENFLYASSRMLERISFYGLRSLIVLYMLSESLKMEREEVLVIYGWFVGLVSFSAIIGAIFGDLVIGNRKSIIIGGIIQTIGAFCLCIPTSIGLYIGLFFLVLGNGLYDSNIIANFGKSYLNKPKLLDSGFALFYLVVNFGSFIGVLLISYLGEKYGWNIGFITVGLFTLLSIIPILISKEENPNEIIKRNYPINQSIIKVLIAFIFIGLFWATYEITNIRFFDLQTKLSEISISKWSIPKGFWSSLNSVFVLPISVLTAIIWTYFYSSQVFKLIIGFICCAISYGLLFLIPDMPSEQHIFLYITSLFFIGISELHIVPIIYSILTQYSNPKYLAILISLVYIPIRFFSFIIAFFSGNLEEQPLIAILIGMIIMIISSIILIIYNRIDNVVK